MKKIICYSLMLLFVIVLSLFINFKVSDKIVVHASGPKILQENTYLTFQSTSSFTLNTYINTKNWDGILYYSTNTTHWYVWDGTTTLSSAVNKLYLRGTGNTVITGDSYNYKWVLTGSNIECIGNIENLLDYETVALGNHPAMADYCYYCMFSGCTNLITAPQLPATTLADYCYYSMFSGCTNLITAPQLPATTMANYCYYGMFYGCTNLTTAPSLPATTLAKSCYQYMFGGCTNLTTAPQLPATTLADYCYRDMFRDCSLFKVSATQTETYQYAWRIPTSGMGTTATSWNTDMLKNTGGPFTGNPTIDTTYYVENPPVSGSGFIITFEENGGTTIPDIEEATELPTPLPTPTKSGYTFLGWYYDSDFTNEAFPEDPLTGDVTLYAKWELNTYTITYNSNGGSSIPQSSGATQLPNPLPTTTKSGYTFRGWYYDSDFINEAFADDPLTGDVTLYAKWQKNYRIFYNTNGGNTIPSISTDIIPDNLPIPERNDDIFIGWYYDESLSDPVETNDILSSDITIYASWIDYDGIIEYFNVIYNNGFDDGYDDSFDDSFDQGYDLGFEYGYPYGYDDGYRDGLMEDHPIEFSEFFDKGFFDARDKYGKQIDDYQWESAQIAYENGQKTMGRYSKILMYGIVIITIIGGVILYYSLKRRNG